MILNWIKSAWDFINKIHPETRSLIIILLFGYVLYSLINESTRQQISKQHSELELLELKAEEYAKNAASEINRHVRLIAHEDKDAFNVLLLSYHNSKSSLQGYKFLYLSCITELPKSIDVPLVGNQWKEMDYIYYIDELELLHNLEIIQIPDIEQMKYTLPKLYRLVKSCNATAVSFYVVEGKDNPLGLIVMLYKEVPTDQMEKAKIIMPSILKIAILLDYKNRLKNK